MKLHFLSQFKGKIYWFNRGFTCLVLFPPSFCPPLLQKYQGYSPLFLGKTLKLISLLNFCIDIQSQRSGPVSNLHFHPSDLTRIRKIDTLTVCVYSYFTCSVTLLSLSLPSVCVCSCVTRYVKGIRVVIRFGSIPQTLVKPSVPIVAIIQYSTDDSRNRYKTKNQIHDEWVLISEILFM